MNSIDAKVEEAKDFLVDLDKAFVEEDADTARDLAVTYIENVFETYSESELPYVGAKLLEGYLAINSNRKGITIDSVDELFNRVCKPRLGEVGTEAEKIYNDKKEYILEDLFYEIEKILDNSDVVSVIKKCFTHCEINKTSTDERKEDIRIAIDALKDKNLRAFIKNYALAGKNPIKYLKKVDPKGIALKEISKKYDNDLLEALDIGGDSPEFGIAGDNCRLVKRVHELITQKNKKNKKVKRKKQ